MIIEAIKDLNIDNSFTNWISDYFYSRVLAGDVLDKYDIDHKNKIFYILANRYNDFVKELIGKDILEDIHFNGINDKFCLRINSLTEDEFLLLELNNIIVHENLKISNKNYKGAI